jgi:hypothetical protein
LGAFLIDLIWNHTIAKIVNTPGESVFETTSIYLFLETKTHLETNTHKVFEA